MEKYSGIKFKTEFVGKKLSKDSRLKELKNWCQKFSGNGLTPIINGLAAGNLSFRLEPNQNQFIITATGLKAKDNPDENSFVTIQSCDLNKKIIKVEGTREPSSEAMIHYAIYNQRKDVNAIFHGHSKKILDQANKLNIPQTTKQESYGTIELVQSVLDILNNHSFLIIKNHGFIALGKKMTEAGELTLAINNKL